MRTITHEGALTPKAARSTIRQVGIIKNFPAVGGVAKTVNVTTSFEMDDADEYITFTVYLFKKFGADLSYWVEDADTYYQNPREPTQFLKLADIQDVLAGGTITRTIHQTGTTKTYTLDLTEYGRVMSNWSGNVYIAVVSEHTDLLWCRESTSTVVIEYDGGLIKYATGGGYADCEMYYAIGGEWVQVQSFYGTGGAFVEIG